MKTFQQMSRELSEAKMKLPSGHKELKTELVKVGSKTYELVFSQKGSKVHVFLDGMDTGEEYRDLKTAEKETKNIKAVLKQMGEDFSFEEFKEIFNETNI
jgi:hypothetical protein